MIIAVVSAVAVVSDTITNAAFLSEQPQPQELMVMQRRTIADTRRRLRDNKCFI
jgi:hypothetical protein